MSIGSAGVVVTIVAGYIGMWLMYLVGKRDARKEERQKIRRTLYHVALEEYSPTIRLAMIVMLNDIKTQLEKEWKA